MNVFQRAARIVRSPWTPGLLSLGGWAAMARLSRDFVWGGGHEARPILLFAGVLGIQWLLFIWALVAARSQPTPMGKPLGFAALGLLFHLLFLGSNPIQEHDAYRYLWDGATLSSGASPYAYTPQATLDAVDAIDGGPAPPDRQRLVARVRSDPHALATLQRVGYPDVPTIYPPAAQAAFAAAYTIGGWSWDGPRVLFIGFYFAGVLLVLHAVTENSRKTMAAIALAWCPLAVKEIGNSAHLEALLVLEFAALVWLLSRAENFYNYYKPASVSLGAGVLLGLAVLTKFWPAMLVPILAVWMARRFSPRYGVLCALAAAGTVALGLAPLLGRDLANMTEGMRRFGELWERNAGLYSVLSWLTGSVPAKVLSALLVLAVIIWSIRKVWSDDGKSGERGTPAPHTLHKWLALTICVWFLVLPMAYPWYLLGLCVFAAVNEYSLLPWVLMASVQSAYYLLFYAEYHDLPANAGRWVRAAEYGIPLAIMLFSAVRTRYADSSQVPSVSACASA